MDGVLVVDKPEGPTSHDVVAKVRRGLGMDKVGHTGTLDPMATGVLPLVLGRATKLARYLTSDVKAYRATLRLGITTRTLDAEGEVVLVRPVPAQLAPGALEAALAPLRGRGLQVPPMYSAKKIAGQKLYQLARKGVEVAREAKPVEVHQLEVVAVNLPDLVVDVTCSAGTYVRVLAQDVGEALGVGAHLVALRRTRAGSFALRQAVALAAVLQDPGLAAAHLVPLGEALGGLPRLNVTAELGQQVLRGHQLNVADLRRMDTPSFAVDDALAVAVAGGGIIAVTRAELAKDDLPCARRERRVLRTERVLASVPAPAASLAV